MNELIHASLSCFMFGLLASLHPCGLATTLASMALLLGWSNGKKRTWQSLAFFVTAYASAYTLLGITVCYGLMQVPVISHFLQGPLSALMGPLFILVGLVQSGLLSLRFSSPSKLLGAEKLAPFTMGFLMALSFCPATALMFFGSLIPLAIHQQQAFLFPALYSLGFILPLAIISLLNFMGLKSVKLQGIIDRIVPCMGWLILLWGSWLCAKNIYYNI
ncbi:MAG: hypothetical protein HQL32_10280 [Planctomycetes bacterium]|nr:hypothetical protein [Planctomycetota bacterium]